MSGSSVAIANYFIRKSLDEKKPITAMQVLKLVYIAHGYYLAMTKGQPLIEDDVEAWQYGPVIPVLYHEIKVFKGKPLDSLISLFDGEKEIFSHPVVKDRKVQKLLDAVWHKYGHRSGLDLSSLTHKSNTPWEQVWHQEGGSFQQGAIIPNELIQEHYSNKL